MITVCTCVHFLEYFQVYWGPPEARAFCPCSDPTRAQNSRWSVEIWEEMTEAAREVVSGGPMAG